MFAPTNGVTSFVGDGALDVPSVATNAVFTHLSMFCYRLLSLSLYLLIKLSDKLVNRHCRKLALFS